MQTQINVYIFTYIHWHQKFHGAFLTVKGTEGPIEGKSAAEET
jgi:hypothetical protein